MLDRRKFLSGTAVAGAAMATSTSRAAAQGLTLKTAHPASEVSIWGGVIGNRTTEYVERFSSGRIKVRTFWNNSLIPYKDHYRGFEKGILDFGYINLGNHPGVFPAYEFIQLPGLAPTMAAGNLVLNEMERRYPEVFKSQFSDQVQLLGSWSLALADLHTSKKPVKSLADIQGMTVGVQNQSVADAMSAIGASPSIIPFYEANQQLERGVIDGIIAAWGAMQITKAYEVAKYHTELRMFPNMSVYFMNKRVWDGLSPEDQQVFAEIVPWLQWANSHGLALTSKVMRTEEATREKGHETFTLSPDDHATVRASFRPQWDAWAQSMTAAGHPGEKMLADAIYLTEMYAYE